MTHEVFHKNAINIMVDAQDPIKRVRCSNINNFHLNLTVSAKSRLNRMWHHICKTEFGDAVLSISLLFCVTSLF